MAPSTYYHCKRLEREPDKRSARVGLDEGLDIEITGVGHENQKVYGARKVWKQLKRESIAAARCTVERLMKRLGLEGTRRGKRGKTSLPSELTEKPLELVNRQFTAERPNQLWVADISYVAIWSGFVYMAFVVDVFSRYIIGWRALKSMKTELVLDALEQALWARGKPQGVIHHSDRGRQFGDVPPVEYELMYDQQNESSNVA